MQVPVVRTGSSGDERGWGQALTDVLSMPSAVRTVAEPVVDLRTGIAAGYEMLARFPGPPGTSQASAGPERWFAAAERLGVTGALGALTVRAALGRLDELPPDTFLALNVDPDGLVDPQVQLTFERAPHLDRVVVELTERVPFDHRSGALLDAIGRLRARGARLAVDDVGVGYANLASLVVLRPDLVKIDAGLVAGCSEDGTRRAVLAMLRRLATEIDARVVAEGVETLTDLRTLAELGVPLAQGWLLGRPGPGWPAVDPAAVRRLVGTATGHEPTR